MLTFCPCFLLLWWREAPWLGKRKWSMCNNVQILPTMVDGVVHRSSFDASFLDPQGLERFLCHVLVPKEGVWTCHLGLVVISVGAKAASCWGCLSWGFQNFRWTWTQQTTTARWLEASRGQTAATQLTSFKADSPRSLWQVGLLYFFDKITYIYIYRWYGNFRMVVWVQIFLLDWWLSTSFTKWNDFVWMFVTLNS